MPIQYHNINNLSSAHVLWHQNFLPWYTIGNIWIYNNTNYHDPVWNITRIQVTETMGVCTVRYGIEYIRYHMWGSCKIIFLWRVWKQRGTNCTNLHQTYVAFTLVADHFCIQYVGVEHAQRLAQCVKKHYEVSEKSEGNLYCVITFEWDYKHVTVELSIPVYNEMALHKYHHKQSKRKNMQQIIG